MTGHGGVLPFILLMPSWALNGLVILALLLVGKFLIQVVYAFYVYFLRMGKNLKQYGSWAIVTGCTDGIGKGIVEALASKGLNIVLISRNKTKLDEQAKGLESKYKIQTRSVVVDFSQQDAKMYDPVNAAIKDLDIGILVNNVGMANDHSDYYLSLTPEKIDQLIRLNIYSVVQMTYLILPIMVARKRGTIINLGSGKSLVNGCMGAVYASTKAFVNNFSVALHQEYKGLGVHIQCQLPAFVTTKMSKIRNASFFVCNERTYAKAFLSKIGYEPTIISYWTHALQLWAAGVAPTWFMDSYLLNEGKSFRAKALKKKAEKQQ